MTPLVFLHGVGGGAAAWQRQIPYFTAQGYECLAWDQPGYGGTPAVDPYDFANVCAALDRVLEEKPPAVLVGHSMGGFVAQEMYARRPKRVRALVLSFTSPTFGGTGAQFAREFVAARLGPLDAGRTIAQVATQLMPTMRGSKSDPAGVALAERTMAAIPPETYRKAVRLLTTFDRRANLERIAVPTLLVAGGDDRTAPPIVMQRMALKIPGAEYVVLDGCGHLGPMDQPERFNSVVHDFLRRLGAA